MRPASILCPLFVLVFALGLRATPLAAQEPAGSEVEKPERYAFDPATVSIQVLTGLGAALLPAAPLVLPIGEDGAAGLGALAGLAFGGGAWLGGHWMGGDGSFWATEVGALAGVLVTGLLIFDDSGLGSSIGIAAPLAVPLGSILGYHISASTDPESSSHDPEAREWVSLRGTLGLITTPPLERQRINGELFEGRGLGSLGLGGVELSVMAAHHWEVGALISMDVLGSGAFGLSTRWWFRSTSHWWLAARLSGGIGEGLDKTRRRVCGDDGCIETEDPNNAFFAAPGIEGGWWLGARVSAFVGLDGVIFFPQRPDLAPLLNVGLRFSY